MRPTAISLYMTGPSFFYFTDDKRGKNPVQMALALPKDTGLVFRHYDHPERSSLARQIADITRKRGLTLFVAKSAKLAAQVGAYGCHLPTHMMGRLPLLKYKYPTLHFSVACHSVWDLCQTQNLGADMAYLSPLYPSRSHPTARALSPLAVASQVRSLYLPVYGLGGINWNRWAQLQDLGFAGFGAIDLFELDI